MQMDEADPKGLIRESYAIEGITTGECRSIFIDWALSLGVDVKVPVALRAVIAHFAADLPAHPMSVVLNDGLVAPEPPRRRGGRAARVGA
jgi:hypothetical protein